MTCSRFVLKLLEEEEEENEDQTMLAVALTYVEHMHLCTIYNSNQAGSIMNHRVINRQRLEGHNRLYDDYFANDAVYPEHIFRRHFRMRRSLFVRIQGAVESHDQYFVQQRNAVRVLGLSSLQKITAAMRMLAYGVSRDTIDEYLRLGSSTTIESLKKFVKAIVEIFENEYLRRPNANDIDRLLAVAEQRGFPGMLGSIDCMYWKWKNCPTAWRGSLNDNVLDRSHLFSELAEDHEPKVTYTINGKEYNVGYYLADGIYPYGPTFVKTIPCPQGNKRKVFASAQESARKDVERAFGVLQARFAIIRGPLQFFDVDTLKNIMIACIILHNMIVEDEHDGGYSDFTYDAMEDTPTI